MPALGPRRLRDRAPLGPKGWRRGWDELGGARPGRGSWGLGTFSPLPRRFRAPGGACWLPADPGGLEAFCQARRQRRRGRGGAGWGAAAPCLRPPGCPLPILGSSSCPCCRFRLVPPTPLWPGGRRASIACGVGTQPGRAGCEPRTINKRSDSHVHRRLLSRSRRRLGGC
jgi:hypothetical protein